MPIRIQCECGKKLVCQDEHAGKKTRCPGCGKQLSIPAGQESAARPAAPAPVAVPPASTWARRLVILGSVLVVQLVLIILAVLQSRLGPLGVTDIVRTMSLKLNSPGDKFVPNDEEQNCVLHLRVTGVSADDMRLLEPNVRLVAGAGEPRRPSIASNSVAQGPLGFSVERSYLAFIVPKSQVDVELDLGSKGKIPFNANQSILAEYEPPAGAGFPLILLALAFPVLCAIGYVAGRVALGLWSRLRKNRQTSEAGRSRA